MVPEHDDRSPADRERRDALRSGVAAAAAMIAAGAAGAQAPAPGSLKIVLHVSDPDGWPPALSNARNLVAQFPAIKVRIVTDGGGVYGLQGANDLVTAMAAVARAGVPIEACHNALDEEDRAVVAARVREGGARRRDRARAGAGGRLCVCEALMRRARAPQRFSAPIMLGG